MSLRKKVLWSLLAGILFFLLICGFNNWSKIPLMPAKYALLISLMPFLLVLLLHMVNAGIKKNQGQSNYKLVFKGISYYSLLELLISIVVGYEAYLQFKNAEYNGYLCNLGIVILALCLIALITTFYQIKKESEVYKKAKDGC